MNCEQGISRPTLNPPSNHVMNPKILTAVSLAFVALALNAKADITTSLVLQLNLDETSVNTPNDSSGNANNGTLTANANGDWTWTNGWIAGGLQLSSTGSSNYIRIPDAANLNFTNSRTFTLAAWVKIPNPSTQVSGGALIAKGTGGGGEQYDLDLNAGKYRLVVRPSSGGSAATVTSAAVAANNTWQHIVAICDGTNTVNKTLSLYVNGVLSASAANNAVLAALRFSTAPVTIGARQSASAAFNLSVTNVTMDDVRLYNRVLSPADVYQLYANSGRAAAIATQPRSVTNNVGDYSPFNVAVDNNNSTLPVAYQWQLYGTNLPSATNATFTITNSQIANNGPYSVVISNVIGFTTSSIAYLQVQSLPAVDITSGLVGYWKFDDGAGSSTAADSSVNGNTGTLTSFADLNACWVPGLTNGALFFNGDASAQDLVAIPAVGSPAPPALDFYTNLSFSIALWVNAQLPQTNGAGIVAKGTGNGGEQYVIDINGTTYRFYVRNTNGPSFVVTTAVTPNGTWQHLIASFDAVKGIQDFYVNGQIAGVTVAPLTLISNAHEVSIGNRQAGTAGYGNAFTGAIDDLRFYNRALTSADAAALYLTGGVYPPSFSLQPTNSALYAGDNVRLATIVSGTAPILYQWKTNNVSIPGATNAILLLTNVQLGNAASYTLIASNTYGVATSSVAVLTISPWTPTDALAGYWKFDETTGGTAADSSPNANNANLVSFAFDDSQWVSGRVNGAISVNPTGISLEHAEAPDSPSLNFDGNGRFSIAAWVRGPATQINGAGIVAKGVGSLNEEYALDVTTSGGYRFYIRNNVAAAINLQTTVAPNGTWQHVVATYDAGFTLMNFYVNGQLVASNTAAGSTLLADNSHAVTIGAREQSASSGYNFYFNGTIDDVRIYSRALSAADVQTIYNAAGVVAPVFYTQPQSVSRWVGDNQTLSALVDGTPPLVYQWLKNGSNILGATTSSLTLTNLQLTDAGSYSLLASNSAAPAFSSNAILQVAVFSIATPIGYWRFDDATGQLAADTSGYGNPGTLTDFPGDDSMWVSGRINDALNFNPIGTVAPFEYVTLTNSSGNFDFGSDSRFSLAAWVRSVGTEPAGAAILAKGYGGGGEQYCIDVQNGTYRFFVRQATGGTAVQITPPIAPNGRWQHLVATLDATASSMAFYINGQLVGTGITTSVLPTNHVVSVGCREASTVSGYTLPFQGLIDDVRIYNRALTSNQVQQLYASAPVLPPTIYTQPQSATRYAHDGVTFSVVADGTDPLSYQWKKAAASIPNATNTSLVLANLGLGDAGSYSVQVTDANSSIQSSNALLSVLAVPPPDITNLLVAYWAFDETTGSVAADSSGNNNSASMFGFPTDDSQWMPGIIGNALHFTNAVDPNYRIASDAPLNGLQNANQFTFAFWAKEDPGSHGVNPRFLGPLAGQAWVVWNPGVGVGMNVAVASSQPVIGAWHHFIVLYDRTAGTYSLYVDGIRQVTEAGGYVRTDPTASQWLIGHNETGTTTADSWTGLLDDVRIYNRLLTINDAQALYLIAGQPQLSLSNSGISLTLSWPVGAAGFHLQNAGAVASSGTVWSNVTATPVQSADGASQSVTVTTTGRQFYRLVKP